MERLTLEQIAPYLPYGLHKYIESLDGKRQLSYELFATSIPSVLANQNKPILYPMSLTTPIKIDGVEVVPLFELAKIAFPLLANDNKPFEILTEEYTDNGIAIDNFYGRLLFYYQENTFKSWQEHTNKPELDCSFDVSQQLALFQWLFKNKFDVFGLCEKGLAVDVNTLETNPYE